MSEEKVKKPGKVRKFFKWFAIIFFGIFLAALIYLQAPIKVIILVAIFYFANILLKKPYLKYFWLTVLAVVIGLTVWVFLPEDNEGWQPFVFQDEIDALNEKYKVPDEQNAALIYDEIFAGLSEKGLEPNIPEDVDCFVQDNPWTAEQYPELAQWLKEKQPLMDKVRQASQLKYYNEVNEKNILSIDLDTFGHYRRFSYIEIRNFYLNLGNNNIDGAISSLSSLFGRANQLFQQPILIKAMVGLSLDALAREKMNYLVVNYDLTDLQLQQVEYYLKKNNFSWDKIFSEVMEYEQCYSKHMFIVLLYETKDGKVRFNRDQMSTLQRYWPNEELYKKKSSFIRKKLQKLRAVFSWFTMPTDPYELERIYDETCKLYFETNTDIGRLKWNYEYMMKFTASMLAPSLSRTEGIFKNHGSKYNGSMILLAMREYKNKNGIWPESLEELNIENIDLTGFVYNKIDEDHFILYSIGENGIDEGEYGKQCGSRSVGTKDDVLIWPQNEEDLEKLKN